MAEPEPNESTLLSVAESISDGARVDWDRVQERPADAQNTEVLRQLRLLDRIATFHRSTDPTSLPTDPSDKHVPNDEGTSDIELQTWGHLAIIDKIGEGTFGVVYRAKDNQLEREVALKLLWPAGSDATVNVSRALKEGRLLARLRHPNVATVYGADQIDGRVGLWMELVRGRTLAELLRAHGPLSAREAALIGLDVCRALAAVHGAGVLHGDIKAHNIMREEGGRTVLMDFGTGKDLSKVPAPHRHGRTDDFAGTPLYLAPEVFEGQRRTKATDIYSLGVLLYHLVTDAYPVDGRTREEVEIAHRRRERRHLRDVRPDLPEEFIQAVERALAADPQHRYQSAGAFEASLGRFLGTTPVPEPIRFRARTGSMVAAACAVALIAAIAIGYWAVNRASPRAGAAGDIAPLPASAAVAPASAAEPGSYRIDTVLYRKIDEQQEVRLRPGARVSPGDRLFVEVRASVPTYLYIVNEDERGASLLLFPLPGQNVTNPLPAGQVNRLPGVRGNRELYWVVDKAGGREHFLIFASPERLSTFEKTFAALPHPELGREVQMAAPLSREAVGILRSVGGLAPAPDSTPASTGALSKRYSTPLGDVEETARGVWVRQLTIDNPTK